MIDRNTPSLPVLYGGTTESHLQHYDCDCACAVEPAPMLAGQPAPGLYDCDCACAADLPRAPGVEPVTSRWVRQKDLFAFPLEGEWQVYYNPNGPVGVAVLNGDARQVLAAFDAPIAPEQALARLPQMPPAAVGGVMHDLAQVGLLQPVAAPRILPRHSTTLSAWLHITEACNLRCPYCYVRKSPRAMPATLGYRAVDRLVELAVRHGYATLKLKYAGGEPTLRFPLVHALHARAARRAARAGVELEGVILTNGVALSHAMLDLVVQAGMRLMVSLDGGPSAHNRLRGGPNGRGSYDSAVNTVERALEWGLHPTISITLTALNLDGAAEAVSFALERGLPFNLNFYRECSTDPANLPSSFGVAQKQLPSFVRKQSAQSANLFSDKAFVPERARLQEAMGQIFDRIALHPDYPLPLTGILDRTRLDVPHRYPCSAGRDYLAVGVDGRVSACQMLLDEPCSDLDAADPLTEIRKRSADRFRAVTEDSQCHTCRWRTACSGGCPLMRGSAVHDGYCQVYQALMPELIRLEASRLIAAHAGLLQ